MGDRNSAFKSSLGRFLTNAWDLLILQLIWIVCSLPVITMGPATSALFSVTLKMARDESSAPAKEFFSAFKKNFKQALVLGLIALAGAAIVCSDLVYALSLEGNMKTVFLIVSGIVIVIWFIFTSFSFPLQARFENTLKLHIVNSFLAAFCAPCKTLLMWVVYLIPAALIWFIPELIAYIGWVYLLFGFSLPVYINSRTLRTIFDTMTGENKDEQERSEEAG